MKGESQPAGSAIAGRNSNKTGSGIEVTQLLADWGHGDQGALEKLTSLVYDELRRLAHHCMERQHSGHTLQTTALVNEAYVRLAGQEKPNYSNRSHFLAAAAKAMRQILVDHARAAHRQKRGAGVSEVELDEVAVMAPQPTREILDLNEALHGLERFAPRKAQVVEMKYFGGLTEDEIAEVLKVSAITVRRDWVFSKAWLYSELHHAAQPD